MGSLLSHNILKDNNRSQPPKLIEQQTNQGNKPPVRKHWRQQKDSRCTGPSERGLSSNRNVHRNVAKKRWCTNEVGSRNGENDVHQEKVFWWKCNVNLNEPLDPGRGPRLMSRLSRQNFGMSRLSRPKLGMSRLWRPWWSVATIATVAEVARPKHRDSYLVCPDSRDQELPFPDFRDRKTKARLSRPRRIWRDPAAQEMAWPARLNLAISRLSRTRWKRRNFPDQHGDGATLKKFFRAFSTEVETARLSRPRWIRRDSGNGATPKATARPAWPARPKCALSRLSRPRWRRHVFADRSGDGATFQTKAETARLSRPMRKWRDFPHRGGDGETKIISSRLRWIRCDFPDQGGDGATFQTKAEKALLSRPSRKRRDQEIIPRYQGGGGATFQTKAETAQLFRPMRRRRDQEIIPRYQGRGGATFQTKAETARLSRPRRRRRDFPDRDGDGTSLQTEAETARLFRPRRRRRDFPDQCGDGATFQTEVETARPRLHSSRLRWIRCDFPDQGGDHQNSSKPDT